MIRQPASRSASNMGPIEGKMASPVLNDHVRKLFVLYYAGQVSSGWVAERLGLAGLVPLWDWMRANDLPIIIGATSEEITKLRVELWAEGTPPSQIDALTDPPSELEPFRRTEPELREIC